MNTSNNTLWAFLKARLQRLWEWILRNLRLVLVIVVVILVIITIIIAVSANRRATAKREAEEAELAEQEAEEVQELTTSISVPEVPLEENTISGIGDLITSYYEALGNGDVDTIAGLVDSLDTTEILRIQETSKYVEDYPSLEIYTKVGPSADTWLVYVCSYVQFTGYDEAIPGMKVFYVCMREDGTYYINENGEGTDAELNYIQEVSLQDDVVDLNNKVTVEYNDMLAADDELAQFILDLNTEIEKNVGEALAQLEGTEPEETEEEEVAEEEPEETTETQIVVTKVRATDVVNIRSSDSETADKLGKAAVGDVFELVEKLGNGWSEIIYSGSTAYIKSDYLEDYETEEVTVTVGGTDSETTETEETAQSTDSNTVTGTVTVKDTVRIRKSASTDSEQLGTAYRGDKLDLIMQQADGWTKISYKGQIAYVKSDYVE